MFYIYTALALVGQVLHVRKKIAMYIYIYMKKKFLKVKYQVEVLAIGAYVFES